MRGALSEEGVDRLLGLISTYSYVIVRSQLLETLGSIFTELSWAVVPILRKCGRTWISLASIVQQKNWKLSPRRTTMIWGQMECHLNISKNICQYERSPMKRAYSQCCLNGLYVLFVGGSLIILRLLMNIFDTSLRSGYFSSDWKKAIVRPLPWGKPPKHQISKPSVFIALLIKILNPWRMNQFRNSSLAVESWTIFRPIRLTDWNGVESFQVQHARFWNKLPRNLRNLACLRGFKTAIFNMIQIDI